ncbi:MAG: hypothetical protein ABIW32_09840 [Terrimesophilobacter sp.]
MSPAFIMTRRWVQLMVGLFLYGFSMAMMIRGAVGVSPWDVLSQGISLRTGIEFGYVTIIVSGFVLLLWIPIRQRLGIGTVLNAIFVGLFANVGLFLIPELTELWIRIPLFTGGLILVAVATGLYIGARFGPGPRDGLMTGIHHRFGVRIWIVRTSLEVIVLIIGWLLGGNVGVGTLAFALLIGPMVHKTMPFFLVPAALSETAIAKAEEAEAASTELPERPEPTASTGELSTDQ